MRLLNSPYRSDSRPSAGASGGGFSLIEIMVAVGLMTVIVLGLLATFDQTTRAFKTGMGQTDVLESGRATMDIITRELEEMAPTRLVRRLSDGNIDYESGVGVNFACQADMGPSMQPPEQQLPGAKYPRENAFQTFFFMSRHNQEWSGTGYFVRNWDGVGVLYRFHRTGVPAMDPRAVASIYDEWQLVRRMNRQRLELSKTVSRLTEGVIHMSLTAYNPNGFLIEPFYDEGPSIVVAEDPLLPPEVPHGFRYAFFNKAVPAAVEIELGILESEVVEQARSIPSATVRNNFLSEQAGRVHVFRQRVAIPNLDPSVYQPRQ